MNRIVAAAAVIIAIWGLKRLFDQPSARSPIAPHNPHETWENEGGAVPSEAWTQSSQVPH
jgi:hypothetical protein